MRYVGSAVEKLVDAVSAVCPDNTATFTLCVLLDDVAVLAEKCTWLNDFDSLLQAFSRRFRHTYRIRVCQCLVTDIICLIKVTVETVVIECHINVEDVAVLEWSVVRDAVAYDFVGRGADGFGEVAVVEG